MRGKTTDYCVVQHNKGSITWKTTWPKAINLFYRCSSQRMIIILLHSYLLKYYLMPNTRLLIGIRGLITQKASETLV